MMYLYRAGNHNVWHMKMPDLQPFAWPKRPRLSMHFPVHGSGKLTLNPLVEVATTWGGAVASGA